MSGYEGQMHVALWDIPYQYNIESLHDIDGGRIM